MKNIAIICLLILLVSCKGNSGENSLDGNTTNANSVAGELSFGEKITAENAVPVLDLPKMMGGNDSVKVKAVGEIKSVCKVKGCWMTLGMGSEESMRVRFKDYGFFVPKDADGKTAVVDGWVYKTVTSVADLRHYAEDDGQSKEEINAITEPLEELSFMASGVLLFDNKK